MKELETAVQTEVDAEKSRPVIIVEITLNAGTLRYAATNVNLVFPTGGNTYTAKAMKLEDINMADENQIVECNLYLDNIAKDMAGYNAAEPFDGKAISIKKIFLDALGSADNYNELLSGYMGEAEFVDQKQWCKFSCVDGKGINRRLLTGIYTEECQNVFGDAKCNKDGYANLAAAYNTYTGTVTACTSADRFDCSGLSIYPDERFKYGRVEITYGGVIYHRRVISFNLTYTRVYLDVAMPTTFNGSAFTIYAGCSKERNCCHSAYNYGPSGDNVNNFRGCQHIGGSYAGATLKSISKITGRYRGGRWVR